MSHHQPETPSNPKSPLAGWQVKVLLALFTLICVAALISTASLLSDLSVRTSQPFESETWKAGGPAQVEDPYHSPRSSMLDDLLDRELLIGLSKDEVRALLGETESPQEDFGEGETWSYWISSGLVDPIFLGVTFDADGIATKTWTYET